MSAIRTTRRDKQILVKCGGFSSQLATHIGNRIDGDPLWASRYDATDPASVIQTHMDFLQNGAQIILSNTYQSSIEGFMKHLKLSKEDSIQLMRLSVKLAKKAKEAFLEASKVESNPEPNLPLIMASIGPYGAHLHDGSEYNGSYGCTISAEQLQNWHRPQIEACLAEGVDGLALETLPCQMEAEALVDMILRDYSDVRFWVSFQCKDEESLANGDSFAEAAAAVWQRVTASNASERCMAIGVNCVNPAFVTPLFESLRDISVNDRIPLIVYSNRGELYNLNTGEWTGIEKCVPLETFVPKWIELGAVIIGGCCRVYPIDILKIRNCIDNIRL